MQNRRRKWHFPLNFWNGIIWTSPFPLDIRNAINWAGAFSKAFRSYWCIDLFRYSLKMPACMIIFKILFSQKHCTLYLYSNGHVWIPIYEFEICASVKTHANRTSPFLLNICNAINWGGASSKAFRSSEALISILSKNACLYDNI